MTLTSTDRRRGAHALPDTGEHAVFSPGPATGRYVPVPDAQPGEQPAVDQSFVPTPVPTQRPAPQDRVDRPRPAPRPRPAGTGPHPVAPAVAPSGAPARPWSLTLWAAGGLAVGLLGVLVMLLVVGWPTAPDPAAPGPSASAVAADGPTATVPTGTLAAAFPDVTALGDRCAPYRVGAAEYVTSTGARPVAVVLCDYGAAVPGGFVYYTEWSTAADAQQWHDDQRSWGPNLDGMTVWGHGVDQRQGPLHRRTAPDGTVYATAAYSGRPYTFDIVTRSLDDSNRMFPAVHLLDSSRLPAGR
ncbi:hypothetical protein EV188_10466 [Actinomycetospora succinea]|uniref:Uncharacterized protein n=1 Tax=Actinomycetospora succinea TaxID=663603 RepID=A0A4R6V921_9PSEU|nr:hypothetical protein [Actinomycetospora succinea]TDQ58327.1 hypothetical protein EV188_10466 [Actinomycetospora succinea]